MDNTKRAFPTPLVLLRTCGLPLTVLSPLKAQRTANSITAILADERWMAEHTDAVCASLFAALKRCGEDERKIRRLLIDAKRNVFNGRSLTEAMLTIAHDLLAQAEFDLLSGWQRRKVRHDRTLADGAADLEQDLQEGRAYLQQIAGDLLFLQGVTLASTSLFEKLTRYIQTPLERHDSRLRKVEISLLAYLSRVAAKTSPFSTFTSVTAGRWTDEKLGRPVHLDAKSTGLLSQTQIAHLPLRLIQEAIQQHPDMRRHVPLWVNPNQWVTDGRRYALQRRETGEPRPRVSHNYERMSAFPDTPGLSAWCTAIRPGETYGEAVARLTTETLPAEKVQQMLDRLIDSGVLLLQFPIPEQQWDLLSALLGVLASIPGDDARRLEGLLTSVREADRRFAAATPAERVELLELIRHALTAACKHVGVTLPPHCLVSVMYEDTTLAGAEVRVSSDLWDQIADDMKLFQRSLILSEDHRLITRALTRLFTKWYGEGGTSPNLLDFYGRSRQALGSAFEAMQHSDEAADILEATRHTPPEWAVVKELRGRFKQMIAEGMSTQEETWEVPREWLHDLVGQLPESLVKPWESYTYLAQVTSGDEPLVALNAIYDGYGHFFARFSALAGGLDAQANPLCQALTEFQSDCLPEGHALAEVLGVFSFNGSLHPPQTPYTIVSPGAWPRPGEAGALPMSDICVQHDAQTDRLRFLTRDGIEIHPVYLGMLDQFAVPPAYRFLLWFAGVTYWDKTMYARLGKPDRIVRLPRLTLGKLVLNRRLWIVPRELLPVRQAGASDFQYMVALNRWREQQGIPDDVFIRANDLRACSDAWTVLRNRTDYARRPQYVQFYNPLLVRLFEKHLEHVQEAMVIEEMLPGPNEQVLEMSDGPRACEILFEVNECNWG